MTELTRRHIYRSLPGLHIVKTHSRQLDLLILSWHRKEIERLVSETDVSPEQALTSLINAQIEEKRAQYHKEHPEYHLTITMSGEPTYSKELMDHLRNLSETNMVLNSSLNPNTLHNMSCKNF